MSESTFPYTRSEWRAVREASHAVLNATLADEDDLRVSCFAELQSVLESLRVLHGQHPILLETEADFADDPVVRRCLYQQAIALALQKQLPTYSMRISLARLLLEECDNSTAAYRELAACKDEVTELADNSEKREFIELMKLTDQPIRKK